MPFADLAEIRLHYEIDGDGPPLLLLAGMMSDSASWGPIVPALAARFTVIRPDNRTTGQTVPQDAPAGLQIWAEDAVGLLDHLGLERAHVAGHSLGGIIALHLAATAPGRVDRLALLASAPLFLPRNAALFRHLLTLRGEGMPPDLWLRGLFPWLFHPRAYDSPDQIEMMVALSLGYPHAQGTEAMARQVAALDAAAEALALPDRLPDTLALLASDDALYPSALARAALEQLGPIRIAEVAAAGHSVHWDAPEAVISALLAHFGKE
jgi:pimeloyl-ACP methyl ester carboxylesterase